MAIVANNTTKYIVKFVENTTRVIGLIESILKALHEREPKVAAMYNDVPGLLNLGKLALINMISPEQQEAMLLDFMMKAINHLNLLRLKDDSVLISNLGMILPESPYVERVQYLYGNNPQGKRYCTEKELKTMWTLIHALVHNSVKHIITNNVSAYYQHLIDDNIVDKWGVDFSK